MNKNKQENESDVLERLVSKYIQEELSLGTELLSKKKKPLAASSALIVEHSGRYWRFHQGHYGPDPDDYVPASVYPAIGVVSLRQHIGV